MKLNDKIHLLQIDFEILLGPQRKIARFVNVIIILGDSITLIDTGVKGSEKQIFNYIESQGRSVNEISRIIISHSHPDHIGSAPEIKRLTGCEIITHVLEREWMEDLELQNRERPVPGFFNLADNPVFADVFIDRDQELKLQDGLTLKLIHSPGHSRGMFNILFVENQILFTADSIPLKNDIPNYDNYPQLESSIEMIKNSNDYNVLLTSWTSVIKDKVKIKRLIAQGEIYLKRIDNMVHLCYKDPDDKSLDCCKLTVERLGLPPYLVMPIVDKAFRSHLI